MTSKNRFYMWTAIILAGIALLMIATARSATRSYAIKNTAHAIPLDSAKLFWGYLGSATVLDSTAGAARGANPQNYDSTITLLNADSSYWVNYRLYPTGDSAMDYRLPDIYPAKWWAFGVGTGLRTVTYWAIDTSASPDDTLSGVKITSSSSGATVSTFTGATGSTSHSLDDATYTVKAARIGYIFSDSSVILTSDTTINRLAYSFPVVLPSDPDVARVYSYIRKTAYIIPGDSAALGLEGVMVTAKVSNFDKNITDTIGTSSIMFPVTVEPAFTDSLGLFEFYLKRTGSFDDTTKGFWDITGKYNGVQIFFVDNLYIPDTGSVNIADSLVRR